MPTIVLRYTHLRTITHKRRRHSTNLTTPRNHSIRISSHFHPRTSPARPRALIADWLLQIQGRTLMGITGSHRWWLPCLGIDMPGMGEAAATVLPSSPRPRVCPDQLPLSWQGLNCPLPRKSRWHQCGTKVGVVGSNHHDSGGVVNGSRAPHACFYKFGELRRGTLFFWKMY